MEPGSGVVAVKVEVPLSLAKFRTPPVVFASGVKVKPNSAVPEEPVRGPMAVVRSYVAKAELIVIKTMDRP